MTHIWCLPFIFFYFLFFIYFFLAFYFRTVEFYLGRGVTWVVGFMDVVLPGLKFGDVNLAFDFFSKQGNRSHCLPKSQILVVCKVQESLNDFGIQFECFANGVTGSWMRCIRPLDFVFEKKKCLGRCFGENLLKF